MGKPSDGADDAADVVVSGTFTGTGESASLAFGPDGFGGNVSLWGTFVGTVKVQRSFDGGTTWIDVTDSNGLVYEYTGPASFRIDEPEKSVLYRLNCTAYTSGTINYRLSA